MKLKRKIKGNIALTTVLFTSSILILGGITLVIASIDFTLSAKSYYNRSLAKIRTRACLQEGLYRIKANSAYTGITSLSFSDGSCTVTVANNALPNVKDVSVSATVDAYSVTVSKTVDTATSPFSVSN